jgi:HD-like signal output (HDOD) protein
MAIPVLMYIKKEEYCSIIRQYYENRSTNLEEPEREAFEFDHQILGGLMAEGWGLPEYLVHSIALHHGGGDEKGVDPAMYLVSLLREHDNPEGNELLLRVAENDYGIRKYEMIEVIKAAFQDAEELSELIT